MQEEWKDIPGFEGLYQVSNLGQVKSLARVVSRQKHGGRVTVPERILKPHWDKFGYLHVRLNKGNHQYSFLVHRLVAQSFIPNPNGLPEVNHKDERKGNNCATNLEWCARRYNVNYGTGKERSRKKHINGKTSKPVFQYSLDGKPIQKYPSGSEVQRITGFDRRNVSACCRKEYKHMYGYIWKY